MWIIITGNPVDGFSYCGPFTERLFAVMYGQDELDGNWWIAEMEVPNG